VLWHDLTVTFWDWYLSSPSKEENESFGNRVYHERRCTNAERWLENLVKRGISNMVHTPEEIERKVDSALSMFMEKDRFLLEKDVHERSITHKLAIYFQKEFTDWDVDCEYNRDGHQTKRLNVDSRTMRVAPNDTDAVTVFPDIIVHHRGKGGEDNNLLVIEVKKTTNPHPDSFDRHKLQVFKDELGYTYALFLQFLTRRDSAGIEQKNWI
jgi:hypothetical protein